LKRRTADEKGTANAAWNQEEGKGWKNPTRGEGQYIKRGRTANRHEEPPERRQEWGLRNFFYKRKREKSRKKKVVVGEALYVETMRSNGYGGSSRVTLHKERVKTHH